MLLDIVAYVVVGLVVALAIMLLILYFVLFITGSKRDYRSLLVSGLLLISFVWALFHLGAL